jgi:hypothetical protein
MKSADAVDAHTAHFVSKQTGQHSRDTACRTLNLRVLGWLPRQDAVGPDLDVRAHQIAVDDAVFMGRLEPPLLASGSVFVLVRGGLSKYTYLLAGTTKPHTSARQYTQPSERAAQLPTVSAFNGPSSCAAEVRVDQTITVATDDQTWRACSSVRRCP